MSLVVSLSDGPLWRCDTCQRPIRGEGLVLHEPLTSDKPVPTFTVHRQCTGETFIRTMMPTFNSRPLSSVMTQLAAMLSPEDSR